MRRTSAFPVMVLLPVVAAADPVRAAGRGDAPVTVVVERVARALSPAAVSGIGGFAGRRIRANREGYLHTFDIDGHVRMVEEKKHRDWWWIGEQPGKWLESAALAAAPERDAALRAKAEAVLARLVAAQEPGGYLGITDPAVRTEAMPLRGMDAYELYFMLHGLLTAGELWDDARALRAARRLGDYFERTIGAGRAEFWPKPKGQTIAGHDVHRGWEGTLLADPMLRLYEATGDGRYLAWSQWAIANLDRWSGHDAFSNLDRVAAATMGIHEVQPYVHAHTFHMNFLAFLRLYRIAGDASLLRKVEGAWRDIASRQMYVTGGVSVGEHYEPGHNLPIMGDVVETCATMSWIELCQALFELTGAAKYHDAIEKLLWNHLFAAQAVDGDGNRYHTPLNGVKPAGYYHGPDCCTGSGHRIIAEMPAILYARGPAGIYVNQFVASTARVRLASGNEVTVVQRTEFPESERIEIEVRPEKPEAFAIHVRLPGWCETPALDVNGEPVEGIATGTYARLARAWRAGDRIALALPMRVRWIPGEHTTHGMVALARGPVVYAIDTVWWDDAAREALGGVPGDLSLVTGVVAPAAGGVVAHAPEETPAGALGPAYRVTVEFPDGGRRRVPILPFANIGTWYCDATKRPDRGGAVYAYAVWLRSAESESYRRAKESTRLLRERGWRPARGEWGFVEDGTILAQTSLIDDCRIFAGDPAWTDYTIEVKARKRRGAEGFLVLFRARDDEDFYWWNIGGWGNSRHAIEREVKGRRTVLDPKPGAIETDRWHAIRVAVRGPSIECFLDGERIHAIEDAAFPVGRIGLGSWMTSVEYKDLRVTAPDETVLLALPAAMPGGAPWPKEKAWDWYERVSPIIGCNYLPRTAVNSTEMWQKEAFDPPTIDRELAWAKEAGYNSARVFTQYLVWKADPEGLKARIDEFLAIAHKHGIRPMLVLFCDCAFAGRDPYLGKQDDPVPGVHNSGWVPSPGLKRVTDRDAWPDLEKYVKDIVGRFAADDRVLAWDLYNEPGASNMGEKSLPLAEATFGWAREAEPKQPLTMGAWIQFESRMSKRLMELSDIVSFHGYDGPEGLRAKIDACKMYERPLICTECLARQVGSRFETILPVFAQHKVGWYNWGLVAGRTQTYMHWGSKKGTPMPEVWQHDIFHPDGKPYDPAEIELIRGFPKKWPR